MPQPQQPLSVIMPPSSIYLDHNATAPPDPDVVAAMSRVAMEAFGNPGSRHSAGRQARRALEDARELVAAILGANPSEVVFTSGGTEANNTAIFGLTPGPAGTIALPAGEHPSIEMAVRGREAQRWKRVTLPLDERGLIRLQSLQGLPEEPWDRLPACHPLPGLDAEKTDRLEAYPTEEVDWTELRLVSLLLAHNETGVIQPVGEIAAFCATHRVPLHLDGVQAVGKIPVNFHELGATTLSLAAHKFHGPRGVGALLVREGTRLNSLLLGGHQEREHRAGTEPVALAVGLARALEIWQADRVRIHERLTQLRDRLESQLIATCSPVVIHAAGAERLPNTLNVGFVGCDGEALLVALDLAGVCCSMGSACASGSSEPAPILLAMGCSRELALSSLRFSVGRANTIDEIDTAAERVATAVARMRNRRA